LGVGAKIWLMYQYLPTIKRTGEQNDHIGIGVSKNGQLPSFLDARLKFKLDTREITIDSHVSGSVMKLIFKMM